MNSLVPRLSLNSSGTQCAECAIREIQPLRQPPTVTVIVICLPTKHLRIGKNSLKRVHALQTELEFVSFSFLELFGGETGLPREKPLGPRERTNNKLNPQYGVKTGI